MLNLQKLLLELYQFMECTSFCGQCQQLRVSVDLMQNSAAKTHGYWCPTCKMITAHGDPGYNRKLIDFAGECGRNPLLRRDMANYGVDTGSFSAKDWDEFELGMARQYYRVNGVPVRTCANYFIDNLLVTRFNLNHFLDPLGKNTYVKIFTDYLKDRRRARLRLEAIGFDLNLHGASSCHRASSTHAINAAVAAATPPIKSRVYNGRQPIAPVENKNLTPEQDAIRRNMMRAIIEGRLKPNSAQESTQETKAMETETISEKDIFLWAGKNVAAYIKGGTITTGKLVEISRIQYVIEVRDADGTTYHTYPRDRVEKIVAAPQSTALVPAKKIGNNFSTFEVVADPNKPLIEAPTDNFVVEKDPPKNEFEIQTFEIVDKVDENQDEIIGNVGGKLITK